MPDNRDIVARHYTATSEGRTADALADFAPDITWIEMAGSPYAGTFVGVDAIVANVFARIEAEHETFAFVPDRLLADGDTVAAVGTYLGRRITGERCRRAPSTCGASRAARSCASSSSPTRHDSDRTPHGPGDVRRAAPRTSLGLRP
ncbi:ketosteroid isomerase-like protein [Pseudoclavibacter chungangensis]|uniref:nuclear transport factor 2 family protein n=1 Tax=Pseudoclavibacter chungangensis TaxID=587635 RepID=UPI0015C8673F|nr:nuclear transport factor 2 family protein [Pseudoclavibacter chungangensis]NYJ67934.1 ketosteroid isomerase-like protein [Pseudoclavibacter chungangensis]